MSASTRVKIVIIDDHPAILHGVPSMLTLGGVDLVVIAAGPSIEITFELDCRGVDVVLLEVPGDDPEPERTVADLVQRGFKVLLFTRENRRGVLRRCVESGASGVLSKSADAITLAHAVLAVGGNGTGPGVSSGDCVVGQSSWEGPSLTAREAEVLRLYACGLPLKSVARRLGISYDTAREYLVRVRTKYAALGRSASTKSELYFHAVEDGFVPLGRPAAG